MRPVRWTGTIAFVRAVIQLRCTQPVFQRRSFFQGSTARVSRFVLGVRLGDRLTDGREDHTHRTDRIVIAGNREIHQVRIAIGVDDGNDRNL